MEQEAALEEARRAQIVLEEREEKRRKIRNKEALIDELMFSSANARNIVQTFAESRAQDVAALTAPSASQPAPAASRATQFSTGIQIGRGSGQIEFLPVPRVDDTPLFKYEAPQRQFDGPFPPSWQQVDQHGYLSHIRGASDEEKAGGYSSHIGCLRALEEAMAGLYYKASRGEAVF